MSGRRGRPRKSGARTKSGRLITPHDKGNDRVVALQSRFARCKDGKAGQQVHDPIGRLWAVDLLESFGADGAAIRDAGRSYAARYWGYYPVASGVSNYENETRRGRHWGDAEDPRGETFKALDKVLGSVSRAAYDAAQDLCLSRYWLPDEDPAWAGRLIDRALMGRGEGGLVRLDGTQEQADRAKLALAVEALLALVAGTRRVRA